MHKTFESYISNLDEVARQADEYVHEGWVIKRTFWEGTDHWETLLAERAAMSGALVLSDFARRAINGR